MTVANEILALRRRLGWTQQRLAAELGTDHGTVSRWERGISAPRRSARRRLSLLGLGGGRRFARFAVGVAMVVVDERRRVLLLEVPESGALEIPSGAVEDGETILDAVGRELTEELGATCVCHPIATVHAYTIRYDAQTQLVSVVYLVAYEGGSIVPSDDATGSIVHWIARSELRPLRDRITVPSEPWIVERALDVWDAVRTTDPPPRARSRPSLR